MSRRLGRATLIPACAVPVSLIGTFAAFPLLGFSINTLSLFGLVLAIGLYVWIGKTFMPTMDEGDVLVQLQKAPSISLEASLQADTLVQQALLREVPEVRAIVEGPRR